MGPSTFESTAEPQLSESPLSKPLVIQMLAILNFKIPQDDLTFKTK